VASTVGASGAADSSSATNAAARTAGSAARAGADTASLTIRNVAAGIAIISSSAPEAAR
jgi:hypothetical protein